MTFRKSVAIFRKNGSSKQLIVVFSRVQSGPKQMEDVCKLAKPFSLMAISTLPQCQSLSNYS